MNDDQPATVGELAEAHARVSALNFLVRTLFANAFQDRPAAFDAAMADMLSVTRTAPISLEPATHEALVEQQARIATHLARFQLEVHAIWRQG